MSDQNIIASHYSTARVAKRQVSNVSGARREGRAGQYFGHGGVTQSTTNAIKNVKIQIDTFIQVS